ncbi:MAG: M48 family metallopeptidase [Actinomycetes bacterium]
MDFHAQQAANQRKTYALLIGMAAVAVVLIYGVGIWLGQGSAMLFPLAVILALFMVWGSYYNSDKLVLTMTGARIIDHDSAPQLFNLVQEITIAAGMPMPKIAIVEDAAPNAFATGRDPEHAVIAFTSGILSSMDREELQGVAAHELAHVANRDTLVMAVAATTAGAIAIISDMAIRMSWFTGGNRRDNNNDSNGIGAIVGLVAIILAPIAALLLRSAISRKREALADATAVAFTRNPTGLRRALESLAADSTVVAQKSNAVAHIWIESPLDSSTTSKLFATHPPIEERIALLKQMEGTGPVAS